MIGQWAGLAIVAMWIGTGIVGLKDPTAAVFMSVFAFLATAVVAIAGC